MDKYILRRENIKSSRINNVKEYSINDHTDIDIDHLDRLFVDIEDYFHHFYHLLADMEKKFRQIPILSRSKAKKDFENIIGLPIGEMKTFVLKISRTWRDIKRAIFMNNLNNLDVVLRTYTYHRVFFNESLLSCTKYSQVLKSAKYIKHMEKKGEIECFYNELKIMTVNFSEYLEQLYRLLILSE